MMTRCGSVLLWAQLRTTTSLDTVESNGRLLALRSNQ